MLRLIESLPDNNVESLHHKPCVKHRVGEPVHFAWFLIFLPSECSGPHACNLTDEAPEV